MNLTPEMINAAKNAKTVEELMLLAKENNVEMTQEQANAYFEVTHKTGELADEELNGVAGGWCYNDGRPVITIGEQHDCFVCKYCNNENMEKGFSMYMGHIHECDKNGSILEVINNCDNCKYCIYEKGLWLCDNPENRK